MMPVYILLFILVLAILYFWQLYNQLVTDRMQVREAWSQIDVQLKRRIDLIPNLVEVVKGYAKHEKNIFEQVSKARNALLVAAGPEKKAEANHQLMSSLKSLLAIAEAYPQLKASENFLQLQKELSDTEDKVAYARQFYNTEVMDYNTKIKLFPNVLIADKLGFKEEEFFQAAQEEKKEVKISF